MYPTRFLASIVLVLIVILVLLGLAIRAPAETHAGGGEEDFVRWASAARIPLEGEGLASYLDAALAGRRFVYLGASDHWIREKYEYRLRIVRELFARGWRTIGMEMDWFDGRRIDRYLATGDVAELDRVALYGYLGGRRTDRDDTLQGFPGILNPELRSAFVAEERRFLGELRRLNESLAPGEDRLRWFGFDVGLAPSVGYEEIGSLLAGRRDDPLVEEVAARLEREPGESRLEEAERLDRALAFLGSREHDLGRLLDRRRAAELLRATDHLARTLRFLDAARGGPSTLAWLQALPVREAGMCRLVDQLLQDLPPREKIIMLGHDLHLSLESEGIRFGPPGSPAPTLWTSVGTHLGRRFPGTVLAIWMSYDHGRHGTVIDPAGFGPVETVAGTVENLLARVGSDFVLDLETTESGAGYLDAERMFRQNAGVASAALRKQIHALVFFAEATEPRRR